MANNNNKAKAILIAALLASSISSATQAAPFLVPKPQSENTIKPFAVERAVLDYLPRPLFMLASLSLQGLQVVRGLQENRSQEHTGMMTASVPARPVPSPVSVSASAATVTAKPARVVGVALRPADPSVAPAVAMVSPSIPRPSIPSPAQRNLTTPPATPNEPSASGAAVFGSVAIPFKRLSALKKLAPALEEMENGSAIGCNGRGCGEAVAAIRLASTRTAQASIRDRLNAVNVSVNQSIRYRTDQGAGQGADKTGDHWSTPRETLSQQQGDCEDFAILKMAALRAEGVDPGLMSIVVLFDQKRHFYHAVLSVEVAGRFLILDNRSNLVLEDTQLPDYQPLYSIRDGKGFLHGSRRKDQSLASAQSIANTPIEKIAPGEGATF